MQYVSTPAVRTGFKNALFAWAATEGISAVDAINTLDVVPETPWCAAEFAPSDNEPMDFSGLRFIESGEVGLYVFAPAGTGDTECARLAESLQTYMLALAPLPDNVEVLEIDPPVDVGPDGAPAGGWFGLSVNVSYQRYIQ